MGRERELDEEELEELREFFADVDSDKSGNIQRREFAKLLENLGSDVSSEEIRIGFEEIDSDSDGKIDFDEFIAYWLEH